MTVPGFPQYSDYPNYPDCPGGEASFWQKLACPHECDHECRDICSRPYSEQQCARCTENCMSDCLYVPCCERKTMCDDGLQYFSETCYFTRDQTSVASTGWVFTGKFC